MRASCSLVSFVGFAVIAGLACREPTQDIVSANGIVAGRIRTSSGAPVSDARVSAVAGGDASPWVDSTLTDANGAYQIRFRDLNRSNARVPLKVSVIPPEHSGLLGRDTTGLTVLITNGYPPRDTTHVDFVLTVP